MDVNTTQILKALSVLEQEAKFPFLVRNKIDELANVFLEGVEEAVHDLLCESYNNEDDYQGLDVDRDTEEEVEFAICSFPRVVSTRGGRTREYPIHLQTHFYDDIYSCNIKAVSFVPLFARLGIELGQFEEEERGGLLVENQYGENILRLLVTISKPDSDNLDSEHQELTDDRFLDVIKQLRANDLFKKEDIQEHGLVDRICQFDLFAEKIFRYLTDWDPSTLSLPDPSRKLPLHLAAYASNIEEFRVVFAAGIHHFPNKKGIGFLFRKDRNGETPFQTVCTRYGSEEIMKVIENTLTDSSHNPDNTADALLSASVDEIIHLDGVYFLLRRQPDLLVKLLSSVGSGDSNSVNEQSTNDRNGIDDSTATAAAAVPAVATAANTRKKRKRK